MLLKESEQDELIPSPKTGAGFDLVVNKNEINSPEQI